MTSPLHLRLLPIFLAAGLTACALPPAGDVHARPSGQDAPARRSPLSLSSKVTKVPALRPRALGRSLTVAELSPVVSFSSMEQALYDPAPPVAVRSAGLRQLAAQHLAEGRPLAAVGAARAARTLAVSAYGPDHVESLNALIDLSDALIAAGRPVEAKALLLVASSDARRLFGMDHPTLRAAMTRLSAHRRLEPITPLLRSLTGRVNRSG